VTGAILNAAGIFLGGIIGVMRTGPLAPQSQAFFKLALGVFSIFFGLRLTWLNINGSATQIFKQIAIVLLAMMLGKGLGALMRFQKASNHIGQYARRLIENTKQDDPHRFINGLNACAILFCASPLGIVGAITDGLAVNASGQGYFYPLALKAVMDGLAMLGFVLLFGGGATLSAFPVLIFQGIITLACSLYVEPYLRTHNLLMLQATNATAGILVCSVGLVIFEVRRIELADYLPSLAVAPLMAWIWK